jgi:hypothetical protein
VGSTEQRHRSAGNRRVKRDDPSRPCHRIQQGGHVGETDQRLWSPNQALVVDSIEETKNPVPAPNAPDCIDGRVSQEPIEIVQALIISSGKVPVASGDVLA